MTVFTVHPSIRGGEPCIAGTAVALSDVLKQMGDGVPPAEIRERCHIDVVTWITALQEIFDLHREMRAEDHLSGSEKRPREL